MGNDADPKHMLLAFGFILGIAVPILSMYIPELSKETVVGIDLGTTFSVIAVCSGGIVQIIPHEDNSTLVPSYVTFLSENKRLVGRLSKNASSIYPRNTIYDAKRLIGRVWSDPVVVQEKNTLLYDIISSSSLSDAVSPLPPIPTQESTFENMNSYYHQTTKKDVWPVIRVRNEDAQVQYYTPTNISTIILKTLIQKLEEWMPVRHMLGWKLRSATISVPANFNLEQRKATIEAGNRAGLVQVQLISEPAAAALAYRLDQKDGVNYVLVFDFGGGTLDVALLMLDRETFYVISTSGDSHLGGEDVDQLLTQHLLRIIQKQYVDEWKTTSQTKDILRKTAELIKITLSKEDEVDFMLDLDDPNTKQLASFRIRMTRKEFDELTEGIMERTMIPVEQVLSDSDTSREDVDEVVLAGGSSRLPKVRKLLGDFFGHHKLNYDINPDEAIARGAALTQKCR